MTSASFIRQSLLSALVVVGLAGLALPAHAQHRARLSRDLSEKLAAGDQQHNAQTGCPTADGNSRSFGPHFACRYLVACWCGLAYPQGS